MNTTTGEASGFQVAFLVFAVVFLSIPIVKYSGPWQPHEADTFGRALIFGTALLLIGGNRSLRRQSTALLRPPIGKPFWLEVTAVTILHLLTPFALCGVLAAQAWFEGGGNALAMRTGTIEAKNVAGAEFQSVFGLFMMLPVGCLLAPIIEELIFRGFMFGAWMRQFGWFIGMILTALAFAIYHPFFTAAAAGSIIYTCVFLRTGSLRAPILVHCLYNTIVSYPLLGRFVFTTTMGNPSELGSWWPQLLCLAAVAVLIPFYIWIARPSASMRK